MKRAYILNNQHIESKKQTKEETGKMNKTVGVVRERERERAID